MPMSSPHLEEALRRSEEFAACLIESSRDCIKVLDLEGHLLSVNAHGRTVREICDFGPLICSPWVEFWDGQDWEHARAMIGQARQGQVGRFTGYFPTMQTNTSKWWDVSVTAILDKDGKPEKLLAVSRDVTELKQTEQSLRQSHEQLEQQVAAHTRDLFQTSTVLQEIVEGVESQVGEQFFSSLAHQLSTAHGVDYAYISELSEDGTKFRSRADWGKGQPLPQFDVPTHGPCETVLTRTPPGPTPCVASPDSGHLRRKILRRPDCGFLRQGRGTSAIMDSKPMPDHLRATSILGIFATRAAAEFERLRFERAMRKSDLRLRKIDEGMAATTGAEFFNSLVKSLAEALQTKYAFVSKFVEGNRARVRTLAFWKGDGFLGNFEYDLPYTPCERVLVGEVCLFPEKVQDLFLEHREDLAKLGVESSLAIPVSDCSGTVMGHLVVMDTKPMHDDPRVLT
jgi:PAS domain S-box-containing protein